MTKLAPEWVRTSDPVIRSPARYRWTMAPACLTHQAESEYQSNRDAEHRDEEGVYHRSMPDV